MEAFWKLFRKVETSDTVQTGEEVVDNSLNIDSEDDTNIEETDYSTFSKKQLLEKIHNLNKNFTIHSLSEAKKIRESFIELFESEKNEALEKFIAQGNDPLDFDYKDKDFDAFEACFKSIKSKHTAYILELNKQKEENFKKKSELLEKLRALINSEETEHTIKYVKEIQDEWKKIGTVSGDKDKELYKSYAALLSQYYDKRSIYNELKELDRKKNLEHKIEICEKAESLINLPSINQALRELNQLHIEFKNTGPVPKDKQEEIWNRFKAASDKIYERKKNFLEALQRTYEENLAKKEQILKEMEPYTNFDAQSIREWNKASEELLAYRQKWKNAGFISRDKSKEYNKRFWSVFKVFFNKKRAFLKKLDKEKNENLAKKIQLCELAEQLWEKGEINEKVLEEIKALQRKWKEIGAVPNKKSNEIYSRFKTICDKFFNKLRQEIKAEEEKIIQTIKQKNDFCDAIEKSDTFDLVLWLEKWKSFGNCNKKEDLKASERFYKLICKLVDKSSKTPAQKVKEKLLAELEIFKEIPEAKNRLIKKEKILKSKIQELENNITLWNNNLGFFRNSKKCRSINC